MSLTCRCVCLCPVGCCLLCVAVCVTACGCVCVCVICHVVCEEEVLGLLGRVACIVTVKACRYTHIHTHTQTGAKLSAPTLLPALSAVRCFAVRHSVRDKKGERMDEVRGT